jgi:hypothetical protein
LRVCNFLFLLNLFFACREIIAGVSHSPGGVKGVGTRHVRECFGKFSSTCLRVCNFLFLLNVCFACMEIIAFVLFWKQLFSYYGNSAKTCQLPWYCDYAATVAIFPISSPAPGEHAPMPSSPRVLAWGRGRIRFLGSAVATARCTSSLFAGS